MNPHYVSGLLAGLLLGVVFGAFLIVVIGAVLMVGRTDALTEPLTESAGNGNTDTPPDPPPQSVRAPPCLRRVETIRFHVTHPLTHADIHNRLADHAADN